MGNRRKGNFLGVACWFDHITIRPRFCEGTFQDANGGGPRSLTKSHDMTLDMGIPRPDKGPFDIFDVDVEPLGNATIWVVDHDIIGVALVESLNLRV